MRKSVVAAVAVIVLGGLGVAAVPLVEKYAAGQIKAELERDGTSRVASVEVGLFARRVTLVELQTRQLGEVRVARWEASGLAWPIGELLQGRTPLTGFRLGDPLQAERVELGGVRVADPAGSIWTIGSLTVEGLDLRRYDAEVAGPYRPAIVGARLMAALSVRRLAEKDIAHTALNGKDRTVIDAIDIEGFDRGKVASLAVTGLHAHPMGAAEPAFRMAEAKASALDLSRVLASMSSADWYLGAPIGRVDLGAASATGFGGSDMARFGVSLGSVTHRLVRESADLVRSTLRIDGFVLAPPLRGVEGVQMRFVMQAMGLKELKLAFECSGSEDRGKSELAFERCAITGEDLGEINLTGKLVHADQAFWHAIDSGDASGLFQSKIALGSARLTLADRSLLERALKALATANGGQPVATARSNVAELVRRWQPSGVLITEDLSKLLETVARFVEKGGTLAIDARPEPPFGVDKVKYFRSPGPDLVNLLGLSATVVAR